MQGIKYDCVGWKNGIEWSFEIVSDVLHQNSLVVIFCFLLFNLFGFCNVYKAMHINFRWWLHPFDILALNFENLILKPFFHKMVFERYILLANSNNFLRIINFISQLLNLFIDNLIKFFTKNKLFLKRLFKKVVWKQNITIFCLWFVFNDNNLREII